MGRTNYFKLAEQIYRIFPGIENDILQHVFSEVVDFQNIPTQQTISSWKSRLRKMGIPIPDLRKEKK